MQIAPPDFDRMFQALADATRRDIVRRAIAGEEGVAELAAPYPSYADLARQLGTMAARNTPRSALDKRLFSLNRLLR
jgi:hypothetical protein